MAAPSPSLYTRGDVLQVMAFVRTLGGDILASIVTAAAARGAAVGTNEDLITQLLETLKPGRANFAGGRTAAIVSAELMNEHAPIGGGGSFTTVKDVIDVETRLSPPLVGVRINEENTWGQVVPTPRPTVNAREQGGRLTRLFLAANLQWTTNSAPLFSFRCPMEGLRTLQSFAIGYYTIESTSSAVQIHVPLKQTGKLLRGLLEAIVSPCVKAHNLCRCRRVIMLLASLLPSRQTRYLGARAALFQRDLAAEKQMAFSALVWILEDMNHVTVDDIRTAVETRSALESILVPSAVAMIMHIGSLPAPAARGPRTVTLFVITNERSWEMVVSALAAGAVEEGAVEEGAVEAGAVEAGEAGARASSGGGGGASKSASKSASAAAVPERQDGSSVAVEEGEAAAGAVAVAAGTVESASEREVIDLTHLDGNASDNNGAGGGGSGGGKRGRVAPSEAAAAASAAEQHAAAAALGESRDMSKFL